MVAWVVKDFGGTMPRMNPRLLPENSAAQAVNADLSSGALAALPALNMVYDLSNGGTTIYPKAYRYQNGFASGTDVPLQVWVPLWSRFSSALPSPLTADSYNRVYWTNPPTSVDAGVPMTKQGPLFNTYARLVGAQPEWALGFTAPTSAMTPTVTVSGGSATPLEARSYVFTFQDIYGSESSPCPPSSIVTGPPDGTWVVTFPSTVTNQPTPTSPNGGPTYPTIAGIWIYRTVTGASTGTQYFRVAYIPYFDGSVPSTYTDTALDAAIAENLALTTSAWTPPPANLDGLTAMPGGMLVGFVGNTLYFCEPYYPHAWPVSYCLTVLHPIVALAVWQGSLVVLTEGYPITGTGTSPANFTLSVVQVPEPCIARGSVVVDLLGVYYASQNGLIMLNYFGMTNQTKLQVTRLIWEQTLNAGSFMACRHRTQYMAVSVPSNDLNQVVNNIGQGLIIDYAEPRLGFMPLSVQQPVTAIWNDDYTGVTYMMVGGIVYEWDSTTNITPQIYRWRSKEFYLQAPESLGAVQISCDDSLTSTLPAPPTPASGCVDETLAALPSGCNALFTLFIHGVQIFQAQLTSPRSILRLPGGFKVFDYQFEIIARVPIFSVELATTMKELARV